MQQGAKCEPNQIPEMWQPHTEVGSYLPALICCFSAATLSCGRSSSAGCLKTTGAREMVPRAESLFDGGSRRLA